MRGPDVALIGLVLPDVPNLSLAALQRALERAGLRGAVVPFAGWKDVDRVCNTVLRLRPRVCGVSIQTTENAFVSLALTRLLRERGFDGHIVCGGHFSTLNAVDILRAPAGIDAVVRFAGEQALVGLARDAVTEEELGSLPGLVFRGRDGAIRTGAPADPGGPAIDVGSDQTTSLHLGFPAADLVLSRGCEAHCTYCCIAGASEMARAEASRAGRGSAGAVYTRASASDIGEVIASLWHRGVRVMNFMDDNLLPLDPAEARAFLRDLAAALARNRVGRFAFSLQLRADVAVPEIADSLVALGLVRAYVGIDGYSDRQLRLLGRHARAEAGPPALETLASRRVFTVCNALLLGPTIPFESLLAEVDGIARIRHAPVHLLPIDVRAGSTYYRRAEARGLLEGGFLLRRYRFEDERTELVARVIAAMPSRLAEHSVPIALYDLGYNLGIARRLVPAADVDRAASTYARVTAAWNVDQVRLLREAVRVAADRDRAAIDALVVEEGSRVRSHDDALLSECEAAIRAVEAAVSDVRRTRVRAHLRGRLLSAAALSMGLAGCGSRSSKGPGPSDSGSDAATLDASLDAATDAAPDKDAGSDASPDASVDAGDCIVEDAPDIPDCSCGLYYAKLVLFFDDAGRVIDVVAKGSSGLTPEERDCLLALFEGYCFPSLAGQTEVVSPHCWIA